MGFSNLFNRLSGGFKDFLFTLRIDSAGQNWDGGKKKYIYFHPTVPGEMIPFDEHIFQMGWFNHQLVGMIFSKNLFVFGAPQDVIAGDGKFPTMNESM